MNNENYVVIVGAARGIEGGVSGASTDAVTTTLPTIPRVAPSDDADADATVYVATSKNTKHTHPNHCRRQIRYYR